MLPGGGELWLAATGFGQAQMSGRGDLGESTGVGRCCRKGIQVVPEPSRRESTGVDGSRVVRTERSSNWQLPIGVQTACEAPLVATRFLSTPVDSACTGRDATSRRVYERGHMREGLRAGLLSCRWDYASERSAAKSHHVRDSPRDSLMQRRYF